MQRGAFVILFIIEQKGEKNLEISDYAGLSKRHPVLAALMSIFMLSLAGIPPFAGFFGKYYLFTAAIEAGYTWLTIIAVISSIISVYFYIGLIVKMYFTEPNEEGEMTQGTGIAGITLAISTAAVIIFGLLPSFLLEKIRMLFGN